MCNSRMENHDEKVANGYRGPAVEEKPENARDQSLCDCWRDKSFRGHLLALGTIINTLTSRQISEQTH